MNILKHHFYLFSLDGLDFNLGFYKSRALQAKEFNSTKENLQGLS